MNYRSDDYVVFWIGFLTNVAAFTIGFSADFILEYVILPRAMYGKANTSS